MGEPVLRILAPTRATLGVAVAVLTACLSLVQPAAAACRDDALGTHRTVSLDPARVAKVEGLEKRLGLKRKEVILTFDDGPMPGKTSRILSSLKRECVKATFFWVGRMARAYPKLVRRAVREGHTIAHHTAKHERLPRYSIKEAGRRIDRGIAQVEKVAYGTADGAPRVPYFRYPYLARNKRTDRLVRRRGLVVVGANVLSNDWKRHSPKRIHDRIMRQLRRDGRGIVLMHDLHARTAKTVPMLLATLKREGWRIVHLVPPGGERRRREPQAAPVVVASADPVDALPAAPAAATRPAVGDIIELSERLRPVPTMRPVVASDTARTGVKVASLLRPRDEPKPAIYRAAPEADTRTVAAVVPQPRKTKRARPATKRAAKRSRPAKRKPARKLRMAAAKPRRIGKRWRLRRSHWIIN